MDWKKTFPGPVSVVLNNPSPPQQHVHIPPAVRTPRVAVDSQATSDDVSTTRTSPVCDRGAGWPTRETMRGIDGAWVGRVMQSLEARGARAAPRASEGPPRASSL
eukprot:4627312-Prymnesium_polylepis.2